MPQKNGPHPALFPVLLAMSHSGKDLERMLDDMITLIQSARDAMQSMRTGYEAFHEGITKIVHQGTPPRPATSKEDVTPLPAKDEPAASNNEISLADNGPEPSGETAI